MCMGWLEKGGAHMGVPRSAQVGGDGEELGMIWARKNWANMGKEKRIGGGKMHMLQLQINARNGNELRQ
jgi:hypothetical protein